MSYVWFVPSIIFLTVVAPIWISHHYRYKNKMAEGITETELQDIDDMLETIDTLSERIDTLEELLSQEHPHWRDAVKHSTR